MAGRLEQRIKALSLRHEPYEYRMITEVLRAEGWKLNRKRVQRVRCQDDLQVVSKARKSKRKSTGQTERIHARKTNEVWSYGTDSLSAWS